MHELPPILTQAIECFGLFNEPATKTLCERVGDVLSESHREDTSHEFRLGLLQGALAIALPQLREHEQGAAGHANNVTVEMAKPSTKTASQARAAVKAAAQAHRASSRRHA